MRDDLLAKRLFFVGCLGLPWLWAVHVLYWFGKQQSSENNENLLEGESQTTQTPSSPEDVKLEERKWVRRSLVGAVIVSLAWITWIVVIQVLSEYVPQSWFVLEPDAAEQTGW
mmetsp:Transcript_6044/g.13463  ORF Transcript_6044/g.13463 Transcript_6044/m.13463 type:complete len:113 (-) Transcript_6044:1166-1504(-)